MTDFFENLRNKPKPKRQRIALTVSILVTFLILGGWSILTWSNFNDIEGKTEKDSKFISPLASVKNSFDNFTESSYDRYLELKESFNVDSDIFTEIIDFEEGEYNDIKILEEETDAATSSEEIIASSTDRNSNNED